MRFRKKPVVIEAIQWTGKNLDVVVRFAGHDKLVQLRDVHDKPTGQLVIETLEGDHIASVGDWIIKGIEGEFYQCKPDIFEQTYELAEAAGGEG